MLIFEPD